jgi:hypothetical protein
MYAAIRVGLARFLQALPSSSTDCKRNDERKSLSKLIEVQAEQPNEDTAPYFRKASGYRCDSVLAACGLISSCCSPTVSCPSPSFADWSVGCADSRRWKIWGSPRSTDSSHLVYLHHHATVAGNSGPQLSRLFPDRPCDGTALHFTLRIYDHTGIVFEVKVDSVRPSPRFRLSYYHRGHDW